MIIPIVDKLKKEIDAQKLFGITMFINYIIYFFIFDYDSDHYIISAILRGIASALCIPLIFMKYNENIRYKRLYWRITLTYCLPFFFIFMPLLNNLSTVWLMNSISAAFFLIILVELKIFALLLSIGLVSAVVLYKYILGYMIVVIPGEMSLGDILATFFAVIVIGVLFTYNREVVVKERKLHSDKVQELNHMLELKVQARTLSLEKALNSKTEFLNNISHEIRTPIQGFTILSEGLVMHWKDFDNDKRVKLSTQVYENAKRLASLLNNLLDLSKFNADKMIMDFDISDFEVSMQEIIKECKSLYINDKSIEIIVNNECSNTMLVMDPERISQVLRNLFANSIKFSPNNCKIIVSLKQEEFDNRKSLHFTIIDEGIGIPEVELETIFDPFTQSALTKTKAGGTGLGLSICKEIITSHHGEIWAVNNDDRGASFHFVIPVSQVG
jgi:signal transduction histidine kinase